MRGGPFPIPLHSSTAAEIRGIIGSGVRGALPPPSPALTAAVLLHQGHLEAVPARRPGVDVHGEVGHGPAQGLAHRRRVAPVHASALAVGTRRSATRRAPSTSHRPRHLGCSPVLDDDTGAHVPGAALVLSLGPRPLLRGYRCLRCLGRRRLLGSALPPSGSHPGSAEAAGPKPEQERGSRNAALG